MLVALHERIWVCIAVSVGFNLGAIAIQDLEHIQGIEWEVIIVDDCQEPSILGDSGYIKTLSTNWKLLLLNGQRKVNIILMAL